jgi:diacylglycerol kinase (ATP)
MSARRPASLLESFNYALEGIIHVLRTHRNMRFHFAAAVIVLVAAVWIGVDRIELAALLISIAFVLIAEMVNSALETAVDMAATTFDPLAKLAKDIAAGAVLISAINAVAVGYLVFSHQLGSKASKGLDRLRDAPAEVTAIALIVTILIVIGTKAYTGRGRPLRGGLPSGHAALAFAGWMAGTYLISPGEHRFLASVIMLIMALLVAQTRVEAGFHSALEVAYGGLLGALTTLVIFQVFS